MGSLPLSNKARIVRGMLITAATLAAINFFSTLDNLRNDRVSSEQLITRAVVLLIALVATAAAWWSWQFAMNKGLRQSGVEGMQFTPASSVWWWLVPFANLSMPPKAMEELWKASDPSSDGVTWKSVQTPWTLWAWWILFLLSSFLDRFGFNAEDRDVALMLALGSSLVSVPAAVLAIRLVTGIDRRVSQKTGAGFMEQSVVVETGPGRQIHLIVGGGLAVVLIAGIAMGYALGPAQTSAVPGVSRSVERIPGSTSDVDVDGLEGKLVFHSNADGDIELFTANANGTNVRQITFNEHPDLLPHWSPDGSQIAFTRINPDTQQADIYIIGADGSGERNITNSPEGEFLMDWGPGALAILFTTGDAASQDLYVMEKGGSNRTKIVSGSGIFSGSWASEDTFLYTDGTRENSNIMFSNIHGDSEILSGGSENDYDPAYSLERSRIAFVRGDIVFGNLFVIIGGDDPKSVTSGSQLRAPTFSPDGELILYSQTSRLHVIDPVRGGRPVRLPLNQDASYADWTQ